MNGIDDQLRGIVLNVVAGIRRQDVFTAWNFRQQFIVEFQFQVLLQRIATFRSLDHRG